MQLKFAELFTGLGLGGIAISKEFPDAKCVFYSEIEKNRCELLTRLHPNVKNIGDIDYMDEEEVAKMDFIVGGPPCKDLSIARSNREGLDGYHSGLFYKYVELLKVKKPKYFLMENVASMAMSERDEISKCLSEACGQVIRPIEINSFYFTGQIRKRLYWCNFPILPIPTIAIDPRHCIDKSVIPDRPTSDFINVAELYSAYKPSGKMANPKNYGKESSDWDIVAWSRSTRYKEFESATHLDAWVNDNPDAKYKIIGQKKISYVEQRIKINMQANTLLTGNGCSIFSSRNFIRHKTKMRPLTPLECARLQGIPDGLLDGWKDSAAYKAIGDSFNLPTIAHIIKSLKAHMESIKN